MWRYLAAGLAAMLLVAAGVVLSHGRPATEAPLPAAPKPTAATAPVATPLPERVPEATPRTREQKRFGRYDKNRDASITRDEYLASRRKAYARLDTNGDGTLSFDEWSARSIAKFAGADKNKSGSLDPTEFATTAAKRKARPADCTRAPAVRDDDG